MYEFSKKNKYPVHRFEALLTYAVTYNNRCALSLYFDQYEYTGGAHGTTMRSSETWNLNRGQPYRLQDFFPYTKSHRSFIINNIHGQIINQVKNGIRPYFENYDELLCTNFSPDNFYLTETGVVIYYQTYELAPYVSGILEFTLPYTEGGATSPACWRCV